MRITFIYMAILSLLFFTRESRSQDREHGARSVSTRIDGQHRAVDSTLIRQNRANEGSLDSLNHRLLALERRVAELTDDLGAANSVDSTVQWLCSELDRLKLENQMLLAKLEAGRSTYASTDDAEFVTGPLHTPGNGNANHDTANDSAHALQLSGYVDAAGSYDNSIHRTDLNLNQVQLDLAKEVSERAGLRADLEIISDGVDGYRMELEQGFVRLEPLSSQNWKLYLGRFNSPIGIERCDPDETYLYTRGFLYDHALPTNLTGIMSSLNLSKRLTWSLMAVNGWNINADNNTGKSVGTRFCYTPSGQLSLGFSALAGPEMDDNGSSIRTIYDFDATLTHGDKWNLSLELHRGQETQNPETNGTARWNGAMLVGHSHLGGKFSATARADYFNDANGSRTGTAQEVKGLAVSPAMSIVEGLDMIVEFRQNWSNRASFGAIGAETKSVFSSALEFTYGF